MNHDLGFSAFPQDFQCSVRLTRDVELPDLVRLAMYRKVPEYGPRILFFSGGSALHDVCTQLIDYTHNSVHLITPFDSGGSSASLRRAFDMLAVGDLRNRLMALADHSVRGQPQIYRLFSYRFPQDADRESLRARLSHMIDGQDPLIADVIDPMRKLIRNHLRYFAEQMPSGFDLRGASIGNLILTGGYLNNERLIDPVIFLFSKLVEVRGTVRPVVGESLHLAAERSDGTTLVGQHLITRRPHARSEPPIKRLYLVESLERPVACEVQIKEKTVRLIRHAELICYPMGSYYTSVIANLLPVGVSQAIRENGCPKVYIPNCGSDPEQDGMTLVQSVQTLLKYLKGQDQPYKGNESYLNYILIDSSHGQALDESDRAELRKMSIQILQIPLISDQSSTRLNPARLTEALLSLA